MTLKRVCLLNIQNLPRLNKIFTIAVPSMLPCRGREARYLEFLENNSLRSDAHHCGRALVLLFYTGVAVILRITLTPAYKKEKPSNEGYINNW